MLNGDTGRVCELNLGGWAEVARRGSDGHYLAFVGSTNYAFPTYSADLAVLDTMTGKLITVTVIPQEIQGQHFVDNFVWAPDDHHLLAVGDIHTSPSSPDVLGLYMGDLMSGQTLNVTPSNQAYTNSPQSLAWSSDGSRIAIRCPAVGVDQICLIPVQGTGQ